MTTEQIISRRENLMRWCLRRAGSERDQPNAHYDAELEYCDDQIALAARELAVLTSVSGDLPHLGLATTAELMEEIAVRLEVTQNSIAGRELADQLRQALHHLGVGILNYTSVGSL